MTSYPGFSSSFFAAVEKTWRASLEGKVMDYAIVLTSKIYLN